ncbi:MAG: hypothetical protein JXB47_19685 [Anaerolineae bacterium]|nr:hypothetical protein [Anaerolineae bacterium]
MRDWNLRPGDPLALRLAADARMGGTDYADDQIWELVMDAPALALQTAYGGRCAHLRITPAWIIGARRIASAQGYAKRPVLRAFAPNYLRVTAALVLNLTLTAEFWVMDSHTAGCRWTFENTSGAPVTFQVELSASGAAATATGAPGKALKVHPLALEGGPVLQVDAVGNLSPVIALEGATESEGAAVRRTITAPAGGQVSVHWVHAGTDNLPDAVEALNRRLFDTDWDEAFGAIEALAGNIPDVRTGDPDWDAAIAFAYKVALSCYVGPTGNLPHPSFIFTRIPAQGYSADSTGAGHGWQWNGQVATEAYVNLPAVAPAAPELAKGVIHNWLAVQEADGWTDWKPGLGGQREGKLSIPLLAATAWLIYEYDEDRDFIAEVFPGLLAFYQRWFAADMDADGDGFPEWRDTLQSAFDDCPTFVRWQRWGQGADITKYECPDLGAYLYREAASLRAMAVLLGNVDARAALDARMIDLAEMLSDMWGDGAGCYHYRDRDTHQILPGAAVGAMKGGETLEAFAELESPNRVLIRVTGGVDLVPKEVRAFIAGADEKGDEIGEELPPSAFYWYRGLGTATSERVYKCIDSVRVVGLSRVYDVEVRTVDTRRIDQTVLLPLWARLPGRSRAQALVEQNITNPARFGRPYGMPNCAADDPAYNPANREGSGGVWMMWNTMLGEALLDYGYYEESAALFTRIMTAQLHTLKHEQAFREAYNSDILEGIGSVDYIWGVTPLHWLMRLIGVRIVSPTKVWAGGRYVLPWPATVQHRGVTAARSEAGTQITFPSGAVVRLTGETWQAVEDTEARGAMAVEDAAQIEAEARESGAV